MLRAALNEPRVPGAPARVWRDWVLVAGFSVAAILEGLLRPDLALPILGVLVAAGLTPTLLYRRTQPLAATVVFFGTVLVVDVSLALAGRAPLEMYSSIYALILVYALFRWGSGRMARIGLGVILVTAVNTMIVAWTGFADAIGGWIVLLATAELGVVVRTRVLARQRAVAQAKAEERMDLARELHDTVAHHVSAIAVQAQAGQALADTDPAYAREALSVIEAEAGRTLAEMQSLVRVLREQATYAPAPGVRDIAGLAAQSRPGAVRVEVHLGDGLGELPAAVDTALYRIAREAVTNAHRHARGLSRVRVSVQADASAVRLTVSDDGAPQEGPAAQGFGLVGMAERAALLGGTCTAGPATDGGWVVSAVLPLTPRPSLDSSPGRVEA